MDSCYFDEKTEHVISCDDPITIDVIVDYFKSQNDYIKLNRYQRAKLIRSVKKDFNSGKLNLNDFYKDGHFHNFFYAWHYKKTMREHFKTKYVAQVSANGGKWKIIGVNSKEEANKWCWEHTNILYTIWTVDFLHEIR